MSYFGLIEAPQYCSQYNNRSQISFALTGFFARANHLFYRFRTVFRLRNVIRPWYESRVRPVSPSDLVLPRLRASVAARALVVFVLYSLLFRHRFVIIRLLSFKIHVRYSCEFFYSILGVFYISVERLEVFRFKIFRHAGRKENIPEEQADRLCLV